jgi:carbon storage regulator
MLVLMRRQGQAICIGEGIELTILSVAGDNVRVGVQAPRDISVDRKEVRERKTLNPQGSK